MRWLKALIMFGVFMCLCPYVMSLSNRLSMTWQLVIVMVVAGVASLLVDLLVYRLERP